MLRGKHKAPQKISALLMGELYHECPFFQGRGFPEITLRDSFGHFVSSSFRPFPLRVLRDLLVQSLPLLCAGNESERLGQKNRGGLIFLSSIFLTDPLLAEIGRASCRERV